MNDVATLAPPVPQARLFQRLRWSLLRNSVRALVQHAWLRVATILACSAVVWLSVFFISLVGFSFLRNNGFPMVGGVVGITFDLLFLALMVMLLFSSSIILYSSLFASAETAFLLSLPARADRVFAYKYQGAIVFGSWAFVLLGSPILIAYGVTNGAGPGFYLALPLFFLGFTLLPGSLGALVCLLIVNYLPQRRKQALAAGALLALACLAFWGYRVSTATRVNDWNRDALHTLIGRFTFSQTPFYPSHWMAEGLQAAARGQLGPTLYYLALIWSNGLLLYVLSAWAATGMYRRGFNRMATGGSLRKRYGGGWLDRGLSTLVGFLDPQIRLLIVKDFRTFRRDPAQWAQILIFTGLLVLYFVNIHNLGLERIGWAYRTGISLLNLSATSLLLCVYTSRFIYPMLSLEGRKFWILGLLPLRRERLLWGKVAFSATGSVLIAEVLIVLSDLMLEMPAAGMALHAVTVAALALGLSGLSVGLGALMPNFQETDPSKIAVGFGGTLNLVAGLGYLVLTVTLMSGPWHVLTGGSDFGELTAPFGRAIVAGGLVCGLIGTLVATWVPLRLGARALRRMEF